MLKRKLKRLEERFVRRILRKYEELFYESIWTNRGIYGDSAWWESKNLWEPPVVLALRDIVQPGQIALDIGANFGGITRHLSQLVGPLGHVVACEPSPNVLPLLIRNIRAQGLSNVFVISAAIANTDFNRSRLFQGQGGNHSLIHDWDGKGSSDVTLWRIDSMCEYLSINPEIIKLDIEGAEYMALLGAEKTIEKSKPYIIVEQEPADQRSLDFLQSKNYTMYDLNNYHKIESLSDYKVGVELRNLICIPNGAVDPYRDIRYGEIKLFETNLDSSSNQFVDFGTWERARYLIQIEFEKVFDNDSIQIGFKLDGVEILRYHTNSRFLSTSYSDFPLEIPTTGQVSFFINAIETSGQLCKISSVKRIKTNLLAGEETYLLAP